METIVLGVLGPEKKKARPLGLGYAASLGQAIAFRKWVLMVPKIQTEFTNVLVQAAEKVQKRGVIARTVEMTPEAMSALLVYEMETHQNQIIISMLEARKPVVLFHCVPWAFSHYNSRFPGYAYKAEGSLEGLNTVREALGQRQGTRQQHIS